MKRNLKTLLIAALLITAPLFMFAQNPPLPGDTPPVGTEVGGTGAPIGNGTFILLTLAAAFAIRKAYVLRDVKQEKEEE
jgi:hypothetical protein